MAVNRVLPWVLIATVLLGLMLAMAWFLPMPLEPFLDFQVLYRADTGILRGIPLYDLAGQKQMVAGDLGVAVERVFVLPFPYPPWYALAEGWRLGRLRTRPLLYHLEGELRRKIDRNLRTPASVHLFLGFLLGFLLIDLDHGQPAIALPHR